MILVLDSYDSFVYNVARYLTRLGGEVTVVRSDRISVEEVLRMAPSHIVLSPGPCTPSDAGISVELVRALEGGMPLLGVCLGHQAVAEAYGARVVRARIPVHGRGSPIRHRGEGILDGLPTPFTGGRYHSLVVDPGSLPPELEAVAWAEDPDGDEVLMAIRAREAPVWGVQFHPESILTPAGDRIFRNFLALEAGRTSPILPAEAPLVAGREGEGE